MSELSRASSKEHLAVRGIAGLRWLQALRLLGAVALTLALALLIFGGGLHLLLVISGLALSLVCFWVAKRAQVRCGSEAHRDSQPPPR